MKIKKQETKDVDIKTWKAEEKLYILMSREGKVPFPCSLGEISISL